MKLIVPNLTGHDLIETMTGLITEMPHWYIQAKKDMRRSRERLSTLNALNEGKLDLYKMLAHLIIVRERYYSTGEIFLISQSAFNDGRLYEKTGNNYTFRSYSTDNSMISFNRPVNEQELERTRGIIYGFLELHRPAESIGSGNVAIDATKVAISYPMLVLPDAYLESLSKLGLLDAFRESFGKVLEASNHDILHNYTNTVSLCKIANMILSSINMYDDVKIFVDKSVMITEEDIVLGTNARMFRKMLHEGQGRFIPEFFKAIDESVVLITDIHKSDSQLGYAMRHLLSYMLSNYVRQDCLDKADYKNWKEVMQKNSAGHEHAWVCVGSDSMDCASFFSHIATVVDRDIDRWWGIDDPDLADCAEGLKRASLQREPVTRQTLHKRIRALAVEETLIRA